MEALNLITFLASIPCTWGPTSLYLYCIGLTIASIALTVAALLTGPANGGTAFGVFGTVFVSTTRIHGVHFIELKYFAASAISLSLMAFANADILPVLAFLRSSRRSPASAVSPELPVQ